ncbi:MAG: choice-of-anchor D domain-containing protein [Acidobacteria bacterium]|nr:choice-of-anchor D domain-containing protein [Acidobacteriota bacterium]
MKTGTRLVASLLLLTGWYACDRPTPVAPAESTLTIIANPTRIAVNGTAIITVLARKSDGTAVNPGTEINFSTDLGTIDPVVVTDVRGVAEATLAGDGRIGLATVSANSGAAMTATLEVQIGALASSMSLTANKSSVNKDLPAKGEKIKLTAEVFDDLSNPIRNLSVIFESEVGTFEEGGSVVTNLNGRAKNTLVVTEVRNVTDGFFEITARTTGEGGTEIEEILEIEVTGFAAFISLTVTPTSIPMTGGVVRLAALVRDDFGDPAVGDNVNFTTTLGRLASGGGLIPTDEGGQAFDTLTVTATDLASLGDTSITVTAEVFTVGDDPIASDSVTLALQTDVPIAGFDFTVTGLTVNFSNTSTGAAPLTYLWDFGDGGTSTSQNPGNTYAVEGTYMVSLTTTNIGGSNTLTKAVVVAAAPEITVLPTTLNFGDVTNGTSSTLTLTIFNDGSADLSVTGLSISGAAYSLDAPPATPVTLSPGTSQIITVRFTPTGVSNGQTGTLTINSNDANEGTVSVSLTGDGI